MKHKGNCSGPLSLVGVEFYAPHSPELDRFPQALALIRLGAAPLPLVFIGETLFSTGGKLQISEIGRQVEALGLQRNGR